MTTKLTPERLDELEKKAQEAQEWERKGMGASFYGHALALSGEMLLTFIKAAREAERLRKERNGYRKAALQMKAALGVLSRWPEVPSNMRQAIRDELQRAEELTHLKEPDHD